MFGSAAFSWVEESGSYRFQPIAERSTVPKISADLTPKYRRQKAGGQAIVTIKALRATYTGHGTPTEDSGAPVIGVPGSPSRAATSLCIPPCEVSTIWEGFNQPLPPEDF